MIYTVRDSITRPANVTAYAAGDVIAEATTNDHFAFARFLRGLGSDGVTIRNAKLTSSVNAGTNLDGVLYLFSSDIAEVGDNAAFAPTDAEILTCLGSISFPTASWEDMGAAGDICIASGVDLYTRPGAFTVYGVLVARNAYTPTSGEVFTVDLEIEA